MPNIPVSPMAAMTLNVPKIMTGLAFPMILTLLQWPIIWLMATTHVTYMIAPVALAMAFHNASSRRFGNKACIAPPNLLRPRIPSDDVLSGS